jgi:hypothetical protein
MKPRIRPVVARISPELPAAYASGPSFVVSRNGGGAASQFGDGKRRKSVWLLVSLVFALRAALGGSPTQGQTVCVQPPSGIVAWWPFDETSGNIAPDRLGQSPGAWTNGPVSVAGEVRGALSFDGSSYVTVQDSSQWNLGTSDFTIELWANFSAPPGGSIGETAAILIGNDEGPGNRNKWFFAVGGGNLYFHINSPTLGPQFFPIVPFSPAVGQWYHLAVVRTGSTYTVYINGVASGSATNANVIPDPNAPLTIGEAESIGFMHGSLDEVTVYNRGLQPEEIQAIYNAASSGKCINLQVSPNAGGDTGNVSVSINGIGFQQGATVSLAMAGQSSIVGSPVTVGASGTTISTTFILTGQTDGAWDVVVTNPDGASFTLPQGFNVQPGTGPQVWVDVVGIGLITPGRAQTFQIFYGNSGDVDAGDVPVWISGIPPDASLQLGFNMLPPLPLASPSIDYSGVPTSFNTGAQIESAVAIPQIPAGSTGSLQLSVTVPQLESFQLSAWANPPWIGNTASSSSSEATPVVSEADIAGCYGGVSDALIGAVTPTNTEQACAESFASNIKTAFYTTASLVDGEKLGLRDVFNLVWSFGQEAYQCTTALACTACETPVVGEALPESCVACTALNLGQNADKIVNAIQTAASCANVANQIASMSSGLQVTAIQSFDPNSKVGPSGFGTSRFLAGQQPLRYSVSFENDPTATAPAQKVVITDQLDPTKVDLTTLSLGPITFGGNQVVPPPNSTTFATTVSLQPAQNLNVQVTGSLDPNTGLLTWILASTDPTTGNPPTDPAVGFLPPDVTPPQGDGSVLLTVMPKQGVTTGTQLMNQATIVFDANAPIATPTWFNTLDVTPPVSTVNALPATEVTNSGGSATFNVSWSGTDVGSGIASYTVYVSDNGGPFTAWQTATTQTTAAFTGTTGNTYGFYSIATDNVGNVEAPKTVAEVSTQVTAASPVKPTVTVIPSSTSITTGQALTVTVAVGGSSPTPTGSVTLTSGSYASASTTLSSGAATINIPAGSLAIGTDPLVVGYAPDSTSSLIYNSASGSASVSVQGYPAITWATPAAITYGTALSGAQLNATASVAGTFTYVPSSGTVPIAGSQTLTVSFSPTDTTDYLPVSASVTLQVNQASQTVIFTGLPAAATYAAAGPYTLNSSGGASGNPVTYAVSGPASLTGSILTIIGAGTVTVTASQQGNANYSAAAPVSQTVVVSKATSTTVLVGAPNEPIQGQAYLLTATVTGAGQQPSGSVVFAAGTTTVCTSKLSSAGVANCSYVPSTDGSVTVSAQYQGDANHQSSAASLPLNVLPAYDSAIHFKVHRTELVYSERLEGEVCVISATKAPATGTVEIFDDTTLLITRELRRDGCAHLDDRPGLSLGTHMLIAVYPGDDNNPPGTSTPVTVTVSPVPVDLDVFCWDDHFPYGKNYECNVSVHSHAGPAEGSITYTFDGGAPVTLPLSNGEAEFTVTQPTVGTHTVVVAYAQQTNYAAASPRALTFSVNLAPVSVKLTLNPPRRILDPGTSITLAAEVDSWSAGPPDATGSVSFYSGQNLLSTVAVDSNGHASYTTSNLPIGTQTITATYSDGTYYASGSSSVAITITPQNLQRAK